MTSPNKHNFKLNLPMEPYESADTEIKMDGQDLNGVHNLCVKAGHNGYTNVVIEFNANCAIEFSGSLVAKMEELTDKGSIVLANIYKQVEKEMEGRDIKIDLYSQADFVKRIIELTIESTVK